MISSLLAELLPWAIGIAVTFAGIWGYGRSKKKQGRDETYIEMRAKDHENADQIRDRVDRNLDDRVRKHEGAGWRD